MLMSGSFLTGLSQAGFPAAVSSELGSLRVNTTVAEWRRTHPHDTEIIYSHREAGSGDWVIRAENRNRLADGREIVRRAYFYVPPAPRDLTLQRKIEAQKLRDQAQLGFIWIKSDEPDKRVGLELAEKTRAELSRQFGNGEYDLKLWFANAGSWIKTAKWSNGSAIFASAYESTGEAPLHRDQVLAFGFLPISGLRVDLDGDDDVYEDGFQTELRTIDAAIAASGLAARDLKTILFLQQVLIEYHSDKPEDGKAATTSEVLDALSRWLANARRRGQRQYAAALLAGDSALELLQQLTLADSDNENTRARLTNIGANFTFAQLDGYVYTHGWLKKAFRLDRQGPIGDLSLISMMEKGFELSAACGDTGYDGFRRVIFEGERFVSRSRNRKLRPQVHLLVAKAYSDVVALADGAGDDYVEASNYQKQAAWARFMAVAHFRQAMRLRTSTPEQNKLWKAAWRLLAGIPPTRTHFFLCR